MNPKDLFLLDYINKLNNRTVNDEDADKLMFAWTEAFEKHLHNYADDDIGYTYNKCQEILDEPDEEIELIPRKFTKLNIRRD